MRVDGDAFFRTDNQGNRTTFGGEANFLNACIRGNAEFTGAEFRATANFDIMQVGSDAHFHRDKWNNRVTFNQRASFLSAVFGSDALFSRADFKAEVAFDSAHIQCVADFELADFAANAKATFIRTRFGSGDFTCARFNGETDYTGAAADRDTHFSGAVFAGPARFSEARFQAVFFGKPLGGAGKPSWRLWAKQPELENPTVLAGPVDFRGLTYEHIYVHLPDLLARLSPFDRQPYSQLESSLRRVGEDGSANRVYLERRRAERKNKFCSRTIHLWLFDWLYKLTANYGVRPFRLVAYSLVIMWFGATLFSQPGALERDEKGSASAGAVVAVPAGKGFDVSIHYFLPMDSPVGSGWITVSRAIPMRFPVGKRPPTFMVRPDWYGTFLRIAGTALVGLGLAALSGLLRRIAD
jgi:hypothetical protein